MKNSPEGQGNKWLIIFLIYADFTTKEKQEGDIEKLKITINNMLGDIITTPIIPEQSRMFVVMNSIKFVFRDPQNGVDDKSAFYTIERTADRKQNHISKCEILDNSRYYAPTTNGGQVLQKACQLERILEKTCVMADEEVFLITWDHGSSFGMFRAQPHSSDVLSVKKEVERNLSQFPFLKQFWDKAGEKHLHDAKTRKAAEESLIEPCKESKKAADIKASNVGYVPSDNSTGLPQGQQGVFIQPSPRVAEILTNRELNDALQGWLGYNRKVGVLLMVNCWMMNLHTMYALRNSVHCLVAPQGNIDCPGYNIKDILIEINNAGKIGIEPTKLAEVCVTTIDNDYSKAKAAVLSPLEPDVIERFKIFAVDLSKKIDTTTALETHIDLLKRIIKLLVSGLSDEPSAGWNLKFFLQYIRSVCFDFADYQVMMVDIVNWIQSIDFAQGQFTKAGEGLSADLYNPIARFIDSTITQETSIVIKHSSGKKIYDAKSLTSPPYAVIGLPPNGYSIFFPLEDVKDENIKDNVKSDTLLEEFPDWKQFLILMNPEVTNVFISSS